ncbi:tyrosine-type recombinase/integrase [Azospirillum doebereinerae]|nr:site-specific integrase [Azospirillum doebereinerae]
MADKLSDRTVKALPSPASGNRVAYDSEVKGFGVRVTAAGAKAFVLNYRTAGRERRITIGSFPDWSVAAARDEAKSLKQRIDRGEDPLAEREAHRAAPTVAELVQQFKEDYLPRKRPGTVQQYTLIFDNIVIPKIGNRKVEEIKHADIDAIHREVSKRTPIQANRVVAVLSKLFSWSIKLEVRTDNPAQGIERNNENKRARYLSTEEIAFLLDALASHPEPASANAIRLLMLTGARRTEVLAATWSMFDLKAGVWVKPSAHTKQRKEHRAPLSAPSLALLSAMLGEAERKAAEDKKAPSEFLFPSPTGEGPQSEIKKSWASVTQRATVAMWAAAPDTAPGRLVAELVAAAERAAGADAAPRMPSYAEVVKLAAVQKVKLPPGLTDVRVHDLRHTFASILVSSGASLPLIGALLGHTQASTTQRYAHLFDDPLRAAAERVGALVSSASVGSGTNVVPLKRGAL